MSHQPSPKNYRQLSQTGRDSGGLPREEQINWWSSTIQTALKTHILVTLYELNRLFSCVRGRYVLMYSNTYKHAMTTDGKRGRELKEEQGEVYGREEREEGDVVIKTQSQNINKKQCEEHRPGGTSPVLTLAFYTSPNGCSYPPLCLINVKYVEILSASYLSKTK